MIAGFIAGKQLLFGASGKYFFSFRQLLSKKGINLGLSISRGKDYPSYWQQGIGIYINSKNCKSKQVMILLRPLVLQGLLYNILFKGVNVDGVQYVKLILFLRH